MLFLYCRDCWSDIFLFGGWIISDVWGFLGMWSVGVVGVRRTLFLKFGSSFCVYKVVVGFLYFMVFWVLVGGFFLGVGSIVFNSGFLVCESLG